MMTMRFSKEEIGARYPTCETLAELFRAVEKTAEADGRVVCQFRINGVNFTEADEKKLEPLGLEEVSLVEILVDTPSNLLNAVIINWLEELPRMVRQADEISTALREDGFNVQHTPIVRLIDSCQFLIESLVSLRTFPEVKAVVAEQNWDENEKAMTKAVSETCEAFERRDASWVADVIEYDLANSLQRWCEILKELNGSFTSSGENSSSSPPVLSGGDRE